MYSKFKLFAFCQLVRVCIGSSLDCILAGNPSLTSACGLEWMLSDTDFEISSLNRYEQYQINLQVTCIPSADIQYLRFSTEEAQTK